MVDCDDEDADDRDVSTVAAVVVVRYILTPLDDDADDGGAS